jgi:hypothetical protein
MERDFPGNSFCPSHARIVSVDKADPYVWYGEKRLLNEALRWCDSHLTVWFDREDSGDITELLELPLVHAAFYDIGDSNTDVILWS